MSLSEGAVGFRYDADIEPVLPEVLWDMLIRMISRSHLCLAHSPKLCTGSYSMQIVQPADPFPEVPLRQPQVWWSDRRGGPPSFCCGSVASQTSCWQLDWHEAFLKVPQPVDVEIRTRSKARLFISVAWLRFQSWYVQLTISEWWERSAPSAFASPRPDRRRLRRLGFNQNQVYSSGRRFSWAQETNLASTSCGKLYLATTGSGFSSVEAGSRFHIVLLSLGP